MPVLRTKSTEQSLIDLKTRLRDMGNDETWANIETEDFVVLACNGYGQSNECHLLASMNIVPMSASLLTVCEELVNNRVQVQHYNAQVITFEIDVVSDFKAQPADHRIADSLRCLSGLLHKLGQRVIGGGGNQDIWGIVNLEGSEKLDVGSLSEETALQIITKAHTAAGFHPSCIILNLEDAMHLHGPFGYKPTLWDLPIISTSAIPKGIMIAGNFFVHAVLAPIHRKDECGGALRG